MTTMTMTTTTARFRWVKTLTLANLVGFYWADTAAGVRVWVRQHWTLGTWQIHTGDGRRWGAFSSAEAAMRAAEVGIA